jgi:hypothetical protein
MHVHYYFLVFFGAAAGGAAAAFSWCACPCVGSNARVISE